MYLNAFHAYHNQNLQAAASLELFLTVDGTNHHSIFQIPLFSRALTDLFAYLDTTYMHEHIHKSRPAEMTYSVQKSQMFAVSFFQRKLCPLCQVYVPL